MVDARKVWRQDVVLRITGMILVACCWLLMRWLVHSANLRAHHDPSLLQFVAAAAGFLCVSAGSALTTLGAHVFDEVEVSERWARRNDMRPPRDGGGITPACLDRLDREIAARRDHITRSTDPQPDAGTMALVSPDLW